MIDHSSCDASFVNIQIAVRYPGKPVTLVTRSAVLLPTMPTAAQQVCRIGPSMYKYYHIVHYI